MGGCTVPGYRVPKAGGSTVSSGVSSVVATGSGVFFTRNGVRHQYPGNSVSIINGRIFIDGREIKDTNAPVTSSSVVVGSGSTLNISRSIVQSSQSDSDSDDDMETALRASLSESKPKPQPESKKEIPELKEITDPNCNDLSKADLRGFTKPVRQYIESFHGKKKISSIINELSPTKEEAALFDPFIDHTIREDYMDIPLVLNENTYCFWDLCKIRKDPTLHQSEPDFSRDEIQSARKLVNTLNEIVKKVELNRASKQDTSVSMKENDKAALSIKENNKTAVRLRY